MCMVSRKRYAPVDQQIILLAETQYGTVRYVQYVQYVLYVQHVLYVRYVQYVQYVQ